MILGGAEHVRVLPGEGGFAQVTLLGAEQCQGRGKIGGGRGGRVQRDADRPRPNNGRGVSGSDDRLGRDKLVGRGLITRLAASIALGMPSGA